MKVKEEKHIEHFGFIWSFVYFIFQGEWDMD